MKLLKKRLSWPGQFNLNKLFSFLSIRKKLIIAFTLLSSIPLIVIGLEGIYNNIQNMQKFAFANLNNDVRIIHERAEKFLLGVQQDITYLTQSPIFQQYAANLQGRDVLSQQHIKNLLTQEIALFLRIQKIYYRLYFIDAEGNETFKIQWQDSTYWVLPDEQLSDTRYSFYFLLTDSLEPYQLAFVPAEILGTDQQKIAAISFATRIYDPQGNFSGILIADVFAEYFFRPLETPSILELNRQIAIVSSEGFYVYHSEKKKNWNRLLATREIVTLFDDYSTQFAKVILSGSSGIISQGGDEIVAYTPLFSAKFPGSNSYYLFESVKRKFILRPAHHFALIFIPLLIVFVLISISFGYLATSQLAGPIKKLQKGAEIIASGNYDYHLKIETNDEIEQLADQFNQMARAIRQREALLERHRKTLEEMVAKRTFELQEEKEKLQAILDNVPSALILIDENCTIISASAAIQAITQISPENFTGKKCYEVYSTTKICDFCPGIPLHSQPTWPPDIQKITSPQGDIKYIEHLSIPIILNHHQKATIKILTDVTERKKMETHLLKMEKLVATGEMSAIIAHEMRNSLTSVKMILQLQTEKSRIKEDRQSLEVALDSILRMEEILNNLLRFAKPSPFEYQLADVNSIIEECLRFIAPHLKKKRLRICRELDSPLPLQRLDVNHFREALINILLNAIQAITHEGEIQVASRRLKLSRKLEDFLYVEDPHMILNDTQYRVVLDRGSEVIQISIKDDGTGIPRKNLEKIFDPFFTTKMSGTGLGLATTKRIINQHGGIITVKSAPGKGAQFKILLPIQEAS